METLLDALSNWMPWLLRSSWQGAVLVALILVAQGVFGKRLSPAWRHALWGLLLLRLLLVWAPSSSLSVYNLAPNLARPSESMEYVPVTINTPTYIEEVTVSSSPDLAPLTAPIMEVPTAEQAPISPAPTSQIPAALTPEETGLLLWLAVVLAMLIAMLAQSLRLGCRVRAGRLVTDSDSLEILEACRATLRVSAYLAVVETECVRSPALLGCLRPKLLLPIGLLDSLSREEKRHVFLHELAHVKRGDIWTGWLFNLLLTAHWFNPAIWLARRRFIADREAACDAHVLAALDAAGQRGYGHTVLNLVQRFNASPWTPGMAGISENNNNLKQRITMIKQFRPPTHLEAWSGAGLCLCIGLATLTNAQNTTRVVLEVPPVNIPVAPAAPMEPETDIDVIREKAKDPAEKGRFSEAKTSMEQGQGDLQITNSDVYGFTAPDGKTMIAAQITNTGKKDAVVEVKFWSGNFQSGNIIGYRSLLVPAGKTATDSHPWAFGNGPHIISVTVDPGDTIAETDESNNYANTTLTYNNGRFGKPNTPSPVSRETASRKASDTVESVEADLARLAELDKQFLKHPRIPIFDFGIEDRIDANRIIAERETEYAALQLQADDLRAQYGSGHPSRRQLDSRLKLFRSELDERRASVRSNELKSVREDLEMKLMALRGVTETLPQTPAKPMPAESIDRLVVGPVVTPPAESTDGLVVGPEIAPPTKSTIGVVVAPPAVPVELPEIAPVAQPVTEPVIVDP